MPQPRSHGTPRPTVAAGIVIVMLAMVAIPAAVALYSVVTPATVQAVKGASPHGYTWSLLLFVIPIVVIGVWFLPSEGLDVPQKAFWRTIGILAPALGRWVPIEEYFFYLTGFITILLLYVWLSEYWLAAYTVEDYRGEARALPRLLQFHPTSLIVAGVLIGEGFVYKKYFSDVRDGWPGYLIVLVLGGLTPAMSFYPATKRFINWRALSMTMFFIMLVSMLWEATLALPYGWWNYQHRAMMGVFIGAWCDLPIEAVLVWLAVSYGTVILFEAVKIRQASGRPMREMMIGEASGR